MASISSIANSAQPSSRWCRPLAVPATYYYYSHQGNVAVVFAVGDALANPHFGSGFGLVTARMSVERGVAKLDQHYRHDFG